MVLAAIEDWVWRSHAIIAASLAADGTIRRRTRRWSGSRGASWPACHWRR